MFWFFIWFVLSSILIGASVWSFLILMRQKRAWEDYARKKHLVFQRGTLMGPAEMNGVIDNYKIAFYTAQRQSADVRSRRYVSVVELTAPDGLFDGGTAGTKEMLAFMQSLARIHPFKIEHEGWDPDNHVFVKHDQVAQAYFTPDKLEVFSTVLKTRNADVLIVFTPDEFLIRMETTDPMQDAGKIDKIVSRQIALAEKMRISSEERQRLAALIPTNN